MKKLSVREAGEAVIFVRGYLESEGRVRNCFGKIGMRDEAHH